MEPQVEHLAPVPRVMDQETALAAKLPRLAVVSDVCVERTAGGMLLLYRLLRDYPTHRLRVFYSSFFGEGTPDLALPGVQYRQVRYRIPRIVRNRFNPAWPIGMAALMRLYRGAVIDAIKDFAPEAILTVPHAFLWLAAAGAARRLGVPLHLVVHDDWSTLQAGNRSDLLGEAIRNGCRQIMGPIYRAAQSRLVVSPGMAMQYRHWFRAEGTVLYPSRGEDSPDGRVRVRSNGGGSPVVVFCGWIHQEGTASALRTVARIVGDMGGHLDLYTGLHADQLRARGLRPPVVRLLGFLPPRELAERIGESAHMLFLPASFDPQERDNVATLFPSKLADYTAIGLPVLVWGPEYSSAGRWALENDGAAVFVGDPSADALRSQIVRLATDPVFAAKVAAVGLEAGNRHFDLRSARAILFRKLTSNGNHQM